MTRKIKGILFDKDGTLLDFNATWLDPYLNASTFLANSVGKPELAEVLMREGGFNAQTNTWETDSLLASGSNDQIFDFWSEKIDRLIDDEMKAGLRKIFSHAAHHYVPAISDMADYLMRLKSKGITLGIATMDDERHAQGMLEKLTIKQYFDFVCGADSGYGVKPEPGMVLAFCEQCHLSPTDIYMVGDSPKD